MSHPGRLHKWSVSGFVFKRYRLFMARAVLRGVTVRSRASIPPTTLAASRSARSCTPAAACAPPAIWPRRKSSCSNGRLNYVPSGVSSSRAVRRPCSSMMRLSARRACNHSIRVGGASEHVACGAVARCGRGASVAVAQRPGTCRRRSSPLMDALW